MARIAMLVQVFLLAGPLAAEDWVFRRDATPLPADGARGRIEADGERWFHFAPAGEGRVLVNLDAATDLDLELYSGDGQLLAQSLSLTGNERALVDTRQARHLLARVVARGAGGELALRARLYPGFPALPFDTPIEASLGPAHRRDLYRLALVRGNFELVLDGVAPEAALRLEVWRDGSLRGSHPAPCRLPLGSAGLSELELRVRLEGDLTGTGYRLRLLGPDPLPRLDDGWRAPLAAGGSRAGWLLPPGPVLLELRGPGGLSLQAGSATRREEARAEKRALLLAGAAGETLFVAVASEAGGEAALGWRAPRRGDPLRDGGASGGEGLCVLPLWSSRAGALDVSLEGDGALLLCDARGRPLLAPGRRLLAPLPAASVLQLVVDAPRWTLTARRDPAPPPLPERFAAGLYALPGEARAWAVEADTGLTVLDAGGRLREGSTLLFPADGALLLASAGPGRARSLPARWTAAGTEAAEMWGVFVGIGAYTRLGPLRYAPADAFAVAEALRAGGRLAPERCVVLLDEAATLPALRATLADLATRAGPEDVCVLFFSGHGLVLPDRDGDEADGLDEALALVASDGSRDTLSDDLLARWLEALPGRLAIFLDACYSGGFAEDLRSAGRFALFSSGEDQLSREGEGFAAGLLSHLLVEGLGGRAESDGDGQVSAAELEAWVLDTLPRSCPGCDAPSPLPATACTACGVPFRGRFQRQRAVALRDLGEVLILGASR